MRADLQAAINRKLTNPITAFGMLNVIEETLTPVENVLYATKAKVTTGSIENRYFVHYDFNTNISGLLIITTQAVWFFSKRDYGIGRDLISLDDAIIELKKELFSSYIQLYSHSGMNAMEIRGINGKEIMTVAKLIAGSIVAQAKLLEEKRIRKLRRKKKAKA